MLDRLQKTAREKLNFYAYFIRRRICDRKDFKRGEPGVVEAIGETNWRKLIKKAHRLNESDLDILSPIVVLAPHQDDETLGCGGLLSAAAARGLRPRVLYLTDGAASHPGSVLWPPSRLASARRSEALAALAMLGIENDQVMFLDWPDGAPFDTTTPEYELALANACVWFDTFAPKSLWAPRKGEPHCDHEAAAGLADDLAKRRPTEMRRIDYMVWGWTDAEVARPKSVEQVWSFPCAEFTSQRRRALACHLTQTTDLISDSDEAFLIPADLAALVERPLEIFIEHP